MTGAADWAPLVHELGGTTADQLKARLGKVDPELAGLAPLVAELARIDASPTPAVAALDDERRLRTQGALLVALTRSAGRERPLLLVFDDLHRASDAARRLAADLAAAVAGSPLLVVAAAREMPAGTLTAAELALRPLQGADADELTGIALRAAAGEDAVPAADLREWLTRRAAGNPLVAHELARLLRDRKIDLRAGEPPAGLPQGVEQLVLARFDGLPPAVQSAVRVASVVGGTFDAATLRASYGRLGRAADRTLDRAVALDILERRGTGFGFRHGLVAEVVYASMAASSRRSIHAAAARHLVAGTPEHHLDAIADHYARTDLAAEQRRWLRRAADAAAARHDHDAAARHLGGLVPVLRAAPRRAALAQLAASERVTGRWDEAALHLRAALAGAGGEERLELACRLGDLLSYRGDWDEALDLLDSACTGFAAAGNDAREAWALGLLAYAAFRRSAHRRAEAAARRELELAAQLGDTHLAADATHKLAQVAWHVRGAAAAAPLGRRSLAGMRSSGDLVGTLEVANDLAGIELELGQPDRAARRLALAARTARRIGDRAALATVAGNAAELCLAAGDLSTAAVLSARQQRLAAGLGDATLTHVALGHAGYLAARAGRDEDARRLLGEAASLARAGDEPYFLCEYLADLAVVEARCGRGRTADRHLAGAGTAARRAGDTALAAWAARTRAVLQREGRPHLRRREGPAPSPGRIRELASAVGSGKMTRSTSVLTPYA